MSLHCAPRIVLLRPVASRRAVPGKIRARVDVRFLPTASRRVSQSCWRRRAEQAARRRRCIQTDRLLGKNPGDLGRASAVTLMPATRRWAVHTGSSKRIEPSVMPSTTAKATRSVSWLRVLRTCSSMCRIGHGAGRRGAQQRPLGRELEADQRADRGTDRSQPGPPVPSDRSSAAHDGKGSLEAGLDEVVLVVVVVIERAFGEMELRRIRAIDAPW